MKNRYTYADGKLPTKKNTSKERKSMTQNNHNNTPTQQKSQVKQNQLTNQELITDIIEVLTLVNRTSKDKQYYASTLKPNSKSLIMVIGTLLNSLDGSIPENYVEIDNIAQTLKFLGYPQNINKNIFNPVGAPHTWRQCIQFMYWLAQIAEVTYHIRECRQQRNKFQPDIMSFDYNELLIFAAKNDNERIVEQYLKRKLQQKRNKATQTQYQIDTYRISIKNQKQTQKDLKQLNQQFAKLEKVYFRQRQEVIALDRQCEDLRHELDKTQYEVKDLKKSCQTYQQQIQKLKIKAANQQLSSQEHHQIEEQIKQQINDIEAIQQQAKKEQLQRKSKCDQIILSFESYIERINSVNKFWLSIGQRLSFLAKIIEKDKLLSFDLNQFAKLMLNPEESPQKLKNFFKKRVDQYQYFINRCELLLKILQDKLNEQTKFIKISKNQDQQQKTKHKQAEETLKELKANLTQRKKIYVQTCQQLDKVNANNKALEEMTYNINLDVDKINQELIIKKKDVFNWKKTFVEMKQFISYVLEEGTQQIEAMKRQNQQYKKICGQLDQHYNNVFDGINPILQNVIKQRKSTKHEKIRDKFSF